MPPKPRLKSPAPAVLAYLARNPNAQDTLEGITRWWLLEQSIREWVPKIASALAALIDLGYLDAKQSPDGKVHYQASKAYLESLPRKSSSRSRRKRVVR